MERLTWTLCFSYHQEPKRRAIKSIPSSLQGRVHPHPPSPSPASGRGGAAFLLFLKRLMKKTPAKYRLLPFACISPRCCSPYSLLLTPIRLVPLRPRALTRGAGGLRGKTARKAVWLFPLTPQAYLTTFHPSIGFTVAQLGPRSLPVPGIVACNTRFGFSNTESISSQWMPSKGILMRRCQALSN